PRSPPGRAPYGPARTAAQRPPRRPRRLSFAEELWVALTRRGEQEVSRRRPLLGLAAVPVGSEVALEAVELVDLLPQGHPPVLAVRARKHQQFAQGRDERVLPHDGLGSHVAQADAPRSVEV